VQVQLPSVRGQLRRCREQHYWSSQSQTTGDWHGQQLFLSIHTINAGPRRCKLVLKPGSAKAECPGKERGVLALARHIFCVDGSAGSHQPGQSLDSWPGKPACRQADQERATRHESRVRAASENHHNEPKKLPFDDLLFPPKAPGGYGFTTTREGDERGADNDADAMTRRTRRTRPGTANHTGRRRPSLHRRRRLN